MKKIETEFGFAYISTHTMKVISFQFWFREQNCRKLLEQKRDNLFADLVFSVLYEFHFRFKFYIDKIKTFAGENITSARACTESEFSFQLLEFELRLI